VERLFADESPSARRFVTRADVSDINTLRSQLDGDTAVLQYSYRDDDLIAWSDTTDGMIEVYHQSVSEAELERRVRKFRDQCQRPPPPEANPNEPHPTDGQWLADLLFPFQTAMDKSHLIIVAYRALHTLPVHALPFRGAPLLASRSVAYLPSASCISYLQTPRGDRVGARVLAVGNPSNMGYEDVLTGTRHRLAPLRFAKDEASAVCRASAAGSRDLVGPKATKEAVTGMVRDFDILHFATHGLLCSEVPMMSSVALADGEQLTVGELLGRRLKASLAVLSACDTGVGQATDGDDMVGFARSLLAVGVQAIVVSLWPVDDLVTSVLMEDFHRRLQSGQPGSAALRDAQLAARELTPTLKWRTIDPEEAPEGETDYSHPRFWAPFIFIGVE
jgi:CHAT domain-containing protein